MRKIYACENAALVGHLCQLLNGLGIHCVVRNWFLAGDAAGSSPLEWPELWVVNAESETIATDYIHQALSDLTNEEETLPPWRCASCGASVLGHFECCWNCQSVCDASSGT